MCIRDRSSVLLTVSFAIWGFLITCYRKPKMQKLLSIYCFVFTLLYIIFIIVAILLKVYYEEFTDYVKYKCLVLFYDILSVMTLTYYRIKVLVSQDIGRNIVDNIDYVDKSLECLNVKVPHTQNTVERILFTTVLCTLTVYYTCQKLITLALLSDTPDFSFI